MENGIKDFTDLDVWKMARKLRSEINTAQDWDALSISVIKLLNGYIRATKTRQQNAKKKST